MGEVKEKVLCDPDDFEPVTMHRCVWCYKLFKTNNRHICKFSPKLRNCFSCDYYYGMYNEEHCFCASDQSGVFHVKMTEYADQNWRLDCPAWKLMKNYDGMDSARFHYFNLMEDWGRLEE